MPPPRARTRIADLDTSDDYWLITQLLYRYGELMDRGDLDGAAELFRDARVRIAPGDDGFVDSRRLRELWRSTVILYADGTPHTSHVITNPIVDVDSERSHATARSVYTVFQQTQNAIQPIVCGRYHDRFERDDGDWRFRERDYTLVDLVGDVSGHLRIELRADA